MGRRIDGMNVEIKVNKKYIDINPFVKKIISSTVLGMVKSLRGVGKVKEVVLKIKK